MERRKKGSGQVTFVNEPGRQSPWKATVTDNRGRTKTRYFKTEKEARGFLRDVNSDAKKLKALMETGVTFETFSQVFLDEKKKANLKPKSYATLEYNVRVAREKLGNVKLGDIDSDMIQQMIYELAGEGYSESVMDRAKKAVFSVLKLAAAKHFLSSVPVFDITIPPAQKQDEDRLVKKHWMRDDEMALYETECARTYVPQKYTKHAGETLLAHPAGYKLRLALHTGLRPGEVRALFWDDYDEFSKTILVCKDVVEVDGKTILQYKPKTESGERVVILNKQALTDLEMLRKQFDEQAADIAHRKEAELREAALSLFGQELKTANRQINEKYAAIEREHKYICGSTTFPYGMGSNSGTSQTHHKICKKIGLTHNVTLHGLRHTYVTHYYLHHKNDPDFDLATFSKSIGHASIRTTMEIYAHLDMTENRFIQRSMEDLKEF